MNTALFYHILEKKFQLNFDNFELFTFAFEVLSALAGTPESLHLKMLSNGEAALFQAFFTFSPVGGFILSQRRAPHLESAARESSVLAKALWLQTDAALLR